MKLTTALVVITSVIVAYRLIADFHTTLKQSLTFELSREHRCGAWPASRMMTASASRAKCHAGASRLERRVRHLLRRGSPFAGRRWGSECLSNQRELRCLIIGVWDRGCSSDRCFELSALQCEVNHSLESGGPIVGV
jgi:hypothetical protein